MGGRAGVWRRALEMRNDATALTLPPSPRTGQAR